MVGSHTDSNNYPDRNSISVNFADRILSGYGWCIHELDPCRALVEMLALEVVILCRQCVLALVLLYFAAGYSPAVDSLKAGC
ncbi:hypothetical protein P152DRAFT_239485 [Eremomyces bilateralis CBS 781.70]|uniref:Uncharacterized protein n=1 Tax=Eremomyces bilateralis CBS 781.70 TaxID=1392243 RepID=A0A6G1GA44_9PEZI|nr:uncharacterized protein P152DRAFT_239485 [Eremomyces bilateralis CBS 781.70]KAF1814945.1 hypothetical protein P152DRAFT_239485 [Eremomyces bilateralis CBS 781.70]